MMLVLSTPRRRPTTTIRKLKLCTNCASIILRTFTSSSSSSSSSSDNKRFRTSKSSSDVLKTLSERPERLLIFRSHSTDPFFNLALENHILRNSRPDSKVLLTYSNRPCVVIGRNQNAWSEVNLPLLRKPPEEQHQPQQQLQKDVIFVRRLSGGGTVYHDLGNLCWSLITPRESFERDTGAHMVVRALEKMGVSARVNERHDIVVPRLVPDDSSTTPSMTPTVESKKIPETDIKPDSTSSSSSNNKNETDNTKSSIPVESYGRVKLKEFKVSGSAYKLKLKKAYHHATLLLSTDLSTLGSLLRSPIDNFIDGKGVKSVRSDVANLDVDKETFISRLETEFKRMYPDEEEEGKGNGSVAKWIEVDLAEDILNHDMEGTEFKIWDTMDELRSSNFQMGQTPKFTFSIPPLTRLPELPGLPGLRPIMPKFSEFTIHVDAGKIRDCTISLSTDSEWAFVQSAETFKLLKKQNFNGYVIAEALRSAKSLDREQELRDPLATWLQNAIVSATSSKAEEELQVEIQERKRREAVKMEEVERRKKIADWSVAVRGGPVRRVPSVNESSSKFTGSTTVTTNRTFTDEPPPTPPEDTTEQQGDADSNQDGFIRRAQRAYDAVPSSLSFRPKLRTMISAKSTKTFYPPSSGKREFHTSFPHPNSTTTTEKLGKLRFVSTQNTDKAFIRFEQPQQPEDLPSILRPTCISRNLSENLRAHEFKYKSGVKLRVYQVDSQLSQRAKDERRINPADLDALSRIQLEKEKRVQAERIRYTWDKQSEERLQKANEDWEGYQRTHKGGERYIPSQDLEDRVLEVQDDVMVYTQKPTSKPNILPGASYAAHTGKPYVVFDPEVGRMSAAEADDKRREAEQLAKKKKKQQQQQPFDQDNWYTRKMEVLDAEDESATVTRNQQSKDNTQAQKPNYANTRPSLFTQNMLKAEDKDIFDGASSIVKATVETQIQSKNKPSTTLSKFESKNEGNQPRLRPTPEQQAKPTKGVVNKKKKKNKQKEEDKWWYDEEPRPPPVFKPINAPGLTVRKGSEMENDVRWLPDAERKRADSISEWRVGKKWVPGAETTVVDADKEVDSEIADVDKYPEFNLEEEQRKMEAKEEVVINEHEYEEDVPAKQDIVAVKPKMERNPTTETVRSSRGISASEDKSIESEVKADELEMESEKSSTRPNKTNHDIFVADNMPIKQQTMSAVPEIQRKKSAARPSKTKHDIFVAEETVTKRNITANEPEMKRKKQPSTPKPNKTTGRGIFPLHLAEDIPSHSITSDESVESIHEENERRCREKRRAKIIKDWAVDHEAKAERLVAKFKRKEEKFAMKAEQQQHEEVWTQVAMTDEDKPKEKEVESVESRLLAIRKRLEVLRAAGGLAAESKEKSQVKDARRLTTNEKKLSKKIREEMKRETRREKKARKRRKAIASLERAEKIMVKIEAKEAAKKAAKEAKAQEMETGKRAAAVNVADDLKKVEMSNEDMDLKATVVVSNAQEPDPPTNIISNTKPSGKTVMDILSSAGGLIRNRLTDLRNTRTSTRQYTTSSSSSSPSIISSSPPPPPPSSSSNTHNEEIPNLKSDRQLTI